jgi:hypothetical protein
VKEKAMKKSMKKLSLSKETLRSLDEAMAREAVGAAPSFEYSRCDVSCGIACTVLTCPCE